MCELLVDGYAMIHRVCVFNEDDCQDKFNIFYELIMDAINSYFPLKKQKISVYDKYDDQIDPYQFAMKGRSTTQASVFLLHNVLETLDRGGSSARVFFADFSKGFDLVDHGVLVAELEM